MEFLAGLNMTIVLYESPHRLLKTLSGLLDHFNSSCKVSVIKEISKIHETVFIGNLEEVILQLRELPSIKGEYVIVVGK